MPVPSPDTIPSAETRADERSRLVKPTRPPTPAGDEGTASVRDHARRILLSTTLSRLGSRSWEFATPLLLLEWSPGSLAAPAAFGLANALCRTLLLPWLGGRADGWDRLRTVLLGTAMQGLGCLLSVGALGLYVVLAAAQPDADALVRLLSLALVIGAGVVEALGAQLSYVAVKKEWVPIVFEEEDGAAARRGMAFSFLGLDLALPTIDLTFINMSMTNIDLIAAMFGPVLAGWILEVTEGGGDARSLERGFVLIALMNVVSFMPEALLLRRVYLSCPALRRSRGGGSEPGKDDGAETQPPAKEQELSPWSVWFHHPSGLPLLTASIAALYLTALSPSGVVLTAYLVTIGLSPRSIGVFRAAGALSGVAGIGLFSLARNWEDGGDAGTTLQSARSIEQLRRVSLAFISMEVVFVLVAAISFFLYEALPVADLRDAPGLPWQIALFLVAVCASRAGLYSFDIGALEIEQLIVDERYRNAAGSVEGALCSSAEMGMYLLSLLLPDPALFGWQVGVSAAAVTGAGVLFGGFVGCYLMHGHHHGERGGGECCDHGACHDHDHPHTFQQEQSLKDHHGYHVHLHRHQ